ncbi:hypothetical protein M011DRAFT_478030 [Sporormia fimetaria CBS 119925]|uniref:Uncharacterized protein n=1 Tax=Sporormia fimetaria CBS 119925 TaxID=1340428 RepID=A0A6A6V9M8_9PLEO|nr:hypothetical protein M011DRAFT_478030 [Sporormia fimetaria CBS 119925]
MLSQKPIDLQLDWANLVNAKLIDNESSDAQSAYTAMEGFLGISLDVPDDGGPGSPPADSPVSFWSIKKAAPSGQREIVQRIAALLAAVVANGLARTKSDIVPLWVPINGDIKYSEKLLTGFGDAMAWTLGVYSEERYIDGYSIRVEADRYGYSYGAFTSTLIFAFACLFTYALIVCLHLAHLIWALCRKNYLHCDCWGDTTDLVALATNSAPTMRLSGTSAGISKRATWKTIVKIRE